MFTPWEGDGQRSETADDFAEWHGKQGDNQSQIPTRQGSNR